MADSPRSAKAAAASAGTHTHRTPRCGVTLAWTGGGAAKLTPRAAGWTPSLPGQGASRARREGLCDSAAQRTWDSCTQDQHTRPYGLPRPTAARSPLQVTRARARGDTRPRLGRGGGWRDRSRGGSGPTRVPTTPRSAVPAPHTHRSRVYTQTARRGRRRLTPRGGDARGAASQHSPLHAAQPALLTPPSPNPENSAEPNSQHRPDKGLRPPPSRLSLTINRETHSAQLRGVPDAPSGHIQAPARGPPRPQTFAAAQAIAPHPPPALPHDRGPGQLPASLANEPEPEPTPRPLGSLATQRWLFRACQVNPSPPGVSIPQARLRRGYRNNKKANRTTTVGNNQRGDRKGSIDFVSSSAPIPRSPRGPRAHRGRREGAAPCLDDSHPQTSPSPRGRARTLTHARCHRHNQSPGKGGAAWRHSRGPSRSPECCSPGPQTPPRDALPTSAERSLNSCKFGWY